MSVRQLVRHGADVNAAEPRGGQTALMWAAAEGHGDVVAGLVEMGANVNAASKTGFTPLVFAVIKNDQAVDQDTARGRRQSERRPSLGRQTAHRRHAIPAHGCRPDAARGRRRHQRARSCREHDAASGGAGGRHESGSRAPRQTCRSERAHAEIDRADGSPRRRRSSAAAEDPGEQTPLMLAARGDHEEVMRALVAAGADPISASAGRLDHADGRSRGRPAQDVHLRIRARSERRRRDDDRQHADARRRRA